MITEILAPTTASAYSKQFSSGGGSFNIICVGLTGNETATLRFYNKLNGLWSDLSRNGQIYALMSEGNNNINVTLENGLYCIYKTVTTSAVGVEIESQPFSVIFNNQIGG